MRIYGSANTNFIKKNNQAKLEPYFYQIRNINYIHTSDGLLQIENNRIYRIRVNNAPVIKTMIGAFPITVNKTEYTREGECYQVHPNSRHEFLIHKVYKASPTNLVEWICVYRENNLLDNYFSLPEGTDINSPDVKADLLFFLGGLTS
jgi:hypothetical protein